MPSLTVLAKKMLAQAKIIDAALTEKGMAEPSFENDTVAELPLRLQIHRKRIVSKAKELQDLIAGPATTTMNIAFSWCDLLCLRIIYEYKLATAVPLDGSASYAEIAQTSGLNEDLCCRYLHVAMGMRIFQQDAEGRVRHTAASRLLATNEDFNHAISFQTSELAPAGPRVIDAWNKWGQDAKEPNQTGWQLANNTDLSAFAFFGERPERAARFMGAMRYYTANDTWDLRHILRSYDWATLDAANGLIVDVGGGSGAVSQFLAQNTERLTFQVQDLPHVIPAAEKALPTELSQRIAFAAHDFLKSQSSDSKADVFLLRWILHDWPDVYAVNILQGLVPALHARSRVLIYEYVLPDEPTTDVWDRFGFQLDMVMAAAFNGKERTKAQYAKLLAEADPRFALEAIHKPEGSTMSLIEVSWTESIMVNNNVFNEQNAN